MPSIKDKIKELGFSPKKFMGQNFLTNSVIIQKIVSSVEALSPSLIIEVGPGLGALTNDFISLGCPFYVVEKDPFLCQYWKKKGVNVLEGDILNSNGLSSYPHEPVFAKSQAGLPTEKNKKPPVSSSWTGKKVSLSSFLLPGSVLAGNLPYQIAGRLMVQCCPGPDNIKAMVFMFQKEVAQRILTLPGSKNYGLLSVLSQCFWEGHLLTEASTSDFYPRPKVAGQVLTFRKKKHSIQDPAAFLAFIKLCFSQRRKILLSRLKTIKEKNQIIDIFNKMNLSHSVRAEELLPKQFVYLFNEIQLL